MEPMEPQYVKDRSRKEIEELTDIYLANSNNSIATVPRKTYKKILQEVRELLKKDAIYTKQEKVKIE